MQDLLLDIGLRYLGYSLEIFLLGVLFWRSRWQRLTSLFLYVFGLAAVDIVVRPLTLHYYGLSSTAYAYSYWLSDVVLALAAFGLVCAFFRRACNSEAKMWRFLRLVLLCVFLLVLGLSCFSLLRNYSHLFTSFIYEFGQNLYFTCLVLNTLLYIMLQQLESRDDELGLLVCGMGIQFAGPAAALALGSLTAAEPNAKLLIRLIFPLCTVGMLVTWVYALTQVPRPKQAPERDLLLAEGSPRKG